MLLIRGSKTLVPGWYCDKKRRVANLKAVPFMSVDPSTVPQRTVVCEVKVTNLGSVRLAKIQLPGVDKSCVVPDQLAIGEQFSCTVTR
jgi:hypothetical protein